MKINRTMIDRKTWKRVYRIARQPDLYWADPVILDFPVRWLLLAIECAERRFDL